MSAPAPSIVPPTLSAFQWSFGGMTIGQGQGTSGWANVSSDGLDLPAMRSGDTSRPSDTGEFAGRDFLGGRDITLQPMRFGGTSTQLGLAMLQLEQAFFATVPSNGVSPPGGITEVPIYTYRPGFGQLAMMVRGRKYGQKSDRSLTQSKLSQPILLFHATDPRMYGPSVATILSAPSFARGLVFPIVFSANGGKGLSFGGGSAIAEATINNTGTWEMRPILTVTGPCKVPAMANASIAGTPTIAFNLALNAGDRLIIDMDAQSALLVTFGTTVGVSRLYTLVAGSTWWNLPPGNNIIQFSTSDSVPVAATLEVDWAPAYMAAV